MRYVRIGLLMCAVGATSIKDWDPDGPLYAACVNQMRASGGRIAGVLYLQGESEAQSLERAATWFPGFTKLLAAFRRDTALATFVLGEIGTLAPEFTGQQAVRDAQAEAAARKAEDAASGAEESVRKANDAVARLEAAFSTSVTK